MTTQQLQRKTIRNHTHTHVIHAIRAVKDWSTLGYWNGRDLSTEIVPFPLEDIKAEFGRAEKKIISRFSPGIELQIVQVASEIINL